MDMKSEHNSGENLKNAIKLYHRSEVADLLKQGALKQIPEEEQLELCQSLIALRDMKIVDILSRDPAIFQPDILKLDFTSWNNREFIIKVLDKYKKKFNLNDEKTFKQLFDIACTADSTDTVRFLLKQKKAVSCYPLLGGAPDSTFELISQITPSDLNKDQTVELLFLAATSAKGTARIKRLAEAGFDLNAKNSSGQTAADLLSEKIRLGKYSKNRTGELNRSQDRQVLQILEKPVTKGPEKNDRKRRFWKIVVPCAAAGLLIIAAVAYGIGYNSTNTSSGNETEASTAETFSENMSESDTNTDADTAASDISSEPETEYSTDTNLTVENGDTVNIDFIGYIDNTAFDGSNTNGMGTTVTIGSGQYIDDFEEQLIGHKVGEIVEVNVTFPEDYGTDDLNGKDARFEVTINGIYQS